MKNSPFRNGKENKKCCRFDNKKNTRMLLAQMQRNAYFSHSKKIPAFHTQRSAGSSTACGSGVVIHGGAPVPFPFPLPFPGPSARPLAPGPCLSPSPVGGQQSGRQSSPAGNMCKGLRKLEVGSWGCNNPTTEDFGRGTSATGKALPAALGRGGRRGRPSRGVLGPGIRGRAFAHETETGGMGGGVRTRVWEGRLLPNV